MRLEQATLSFIKRLQRRPPVDIVGIGKVLGLNIWESSTLRQGVAGKIFRDSTNGGPSSYSVLVRASDPVARKRFTVAHEIAHYLLHRNLFRELEDDTLYRSSLSSPIEAQANSLAADLLMPEHLLLPLVEAGKTISELAALFGVSEQAMNIRTASMPHFIETAVAIPLSI